MSKGKINLFVAGFIVFLLITSVLPQIAKPLFVRPSGNLKIIGITTGLILTFTILLKWKYVRMLFYFIFFLVIFSDLLLIFNSDSDYWRNRIFLMACHLILLITFWKSESIRRYLTNTQTTETKIKE